MLMDMKYAERLWQRASDWRDKWGAIHIPCAFCGVNRAVETSYFCSHKCRDGYESIFYRSVQDNHP